jgi:hypothetical protein
MHPVLPSCFSRLRHRPSGTNFHTIEGPLDVEGRSMIQEQITSAFERRGDTFEGFKDFFLNAKAGIWP